MTELKEEDVRRIRGYFYEGLVKCESEEPSCVVSVLFGLIGIYIGNFVESEEEARCLVSVMFDEDSESATIERVLSLMKTKRLYENKD